MKVLITGNEGFIGRNFQKYLEKHSHEILKLDIKSGKDCRDYFKNNPNEYFDLVIHCAALVGGRETIDGMPLEVAIDLSIDAEFFNWCIKSRPAKIVYFSSSAAYPISLQNSPKSKFNINILKEYNISDFSFDGSIGIPDMTYGWTKLTGEYLAKLAREKYGLNVYVFRPFSGYGTDQDTTYPFAKFIERAKHRKDPFEVWGGYQIRDFIHVDDIINGVMKILETVDYIDPINLCTGIGTSMFDLADKVCSIAGYSPSIISIQDKPIGVKYRVGDPELFNRFYVPKISLEEGIGMALNGK